MIENFRSIESADIEFDNLTALVGRNGAGKSTTLNALSVFYSLSEQFSEFDYFDCDTTRQITIRVTFRDLTAAEKLEFASYVVNDELSVSKQISIGGVTYRGTRRQIPEFTHIRALPFRQAQTELRALVAAQRYPELRGAPRSQVELVALLDDFEVRNPALTQLIESDTQFLGPTNVGGGKLDKFTRFVRVPAVRDATGETERKGAILQLIDVLVLRSVNARPEVIALNAELEQRFAEIFSRQNLTELDRIAAEVTNLLQRYAPGAALELDFAAIQAPKVPAPQPLARMLEDQFRCPITHAGHGLQRALIFALLERLACMETPVERRTETPPAAEIEVEEEQAQPAPDLILAIEEPELYLHPPRSRFLAKTLAALAAHQEGSRTQVCYTTHSPHFVGLDRFDQIRLARKTGTAGTTTLRTVYSRLCLADAANSLARTVDGNAADFTAASFAAHAAPVMTILMNEGFFGDAIIVVEGISDAAAFTTLQELLNEGWDDKGIVVVPALGKPNIDRPVTVFRGFEIPTYFVFDGDSDAPAADRDRTARVNENLLRLADVPVQEFPPTQVHETWAAFETDLEDQLRAADPEFFVEERARLARTYGIKRIEQTLKNPQSMGAYIHLAFNQQKIPKVLADIVRAVSALV
jgi:hypothetical protein